ncbi:CBU_0592 family membrane protein [Gymnodinialimonas ulvae]|uniref:CBU_0592 family membrane protein n=1 Tax=Gymnodinialimonas ulvae TaxID=3126504 RepID=UPI00309DC996
MHHYYFSEIDFLTVCRAIGLIGFFLYVTGFFCLSVGKLDSSRPLYFGLVLVAATCVMISLWADFNLPAALIQGFYILMSAGGIVMRRQRLTQAA